MLPKAQCAQKLVTTRAKSHYTETSKREIYFCLLSLIMTCMIIPACEGVVCARLYLLLALHISHKDVIKYLGQNAPQKVNC